MQKGAVADGASMVDSAVQEERQEAAECRPKRD